MKWTIRIVAGVVVVLIVAAVVFIFIVDGVTRSTIERNAETALKVDTRLDRASVKLLGGRLNLDDLDVENPEDFDETPRFLRLGQATTDLSLFDLPRKRIELEQLLLEDIDIYLERTEGRANYRVILDNLHEFQQQGDPDRKKELFIHEVILRDITVSVRLFPLGGEATRMELTIPEIIIEDVGSGDDAVSPSELVGVITTSLLAGIFKQGANVLPEEMLEELGKGVAALGEFGRHTLNIAGDVFEGAGELIGTVAEELGAVGEEIIEGAGDALRGIGDLFRRDDE